MDYTIEKLTPDMWPSLLHEIPDPPKALFKAGVLPIEGNKILSVVGSRKYSSYGKEVCESLINGLRGFPITIVSGLALGIDSIAHKTALKANLQTVAIPGSGLSKEVLYPASHLGLATEIIKNGGGLLSEFSPDFRATKWSFPQRNRIMAGLSHAVLVIEAEEKSGTLITSRLATEYNRDVLTVPGSIFEAGRAGPHMLIKLGATPVTRSEDILDALDIKHDIQLKKEINLENFSKEEQEIIKILQEKSLSKEKLLERVALDIMQLQTILMSLEIKGILKDIDGEIKIM